MNETIRFFCFSFDLISCYSLHSVSAPVCTNISENLSFVCQKFHEQHSKTIQYVVLCCQNVWLSCSVPVEGTVQDCFCKVSVWIEVCPLSLSLESGCNRIVSNCFFFASFRKVFISIHQVFDDNCHLNNEFELLCFLFFAHLQFVRILIESDDTFFFCPCKSFLEFCFIVDSLCHTTDDLYLVYRLNSHTKV